MYGWWAVASNSSQGGMLIKYAPNGAELWRVLDPDTSFDHSLYPGAMTISADGEIYTVSWNSTPDGIETVKYAPNGDSVWVREVPGRPVNGNWSQAIVCVPGGVCVGGAVLYRDDERDVVTCYHSDGTEEWSQSLDSSYTGSAVAHANDVTFDREGDIIATGYLDQTDEYYEFATAKYLPTGDLLWLRTEHQCSGMHDDRAYKVRVDSSDNIYVTGCSEGETTGYDYLTVKYDVAGNKQWAKRYDGPGHAEDWPTDLAVDGQGNVIVTGRSHGGPTGFDYATVKYSPAGDELWVRRYDGARRFIL